MKASLVSVHASNIHFKVKLHVLISPGNKDGNYYLDRVPNSENNNLVKLAEKR